MKASDIAIKHLIDAHILLSIDSKSIEMYNRDIDFVKWLILKFKGNLNKEIDVDKIWKEFLDSIK